MGKSVGGTTQGTQQNTTAVNTGPWLPQQGPLQDVFNKAQQNYDNTRANGGYYPGETVAPLNQFQNTPLNIISAIGGGNDPNVTAARTNNLDTINGKYLDPSTNPWLSKTYDVAGDAVTRQYMTGTAPQTAGAMAGAGRYGSGSYANLAKGNQITYGKTLDDLATGIYGGNYQSERDRQMSAVGEAPALDQAQFINPMMALNAGNQVQAQQQAEDNARLATYNYNRDLPTTALNTYLGQIQGNYGQTGTTTSTGANANPYFTNPTASALGGGLGLASLFSGGDKSAASGIAGGLGSLFGKGGAAAGGAGIADLAALPLMFL